MRLFFALIIFLTFWISNAFSYVELGFNYSYDRQVYGSNRQNKMTSTAYGGSWAWYMFELTAIELNYSEMETIIKENETTVVDAATNLKILGTTNTVNSYTWGVGLRQMLSSRKARIQPMVSAGYARTFQDSKTNYSVSDNGTVYNVESSVKRTRTDNVFGTFTLKFVLTQTMALTASVRTQFPAFEWNEARNFIRYTGGMSWLF